MTNTTHSEDECETCNSFCCTCELCECCKKHLVTSSAGERVMESYAPSPFEVNMANEILELQKLLQNEKEISDALFVSLVNHGYNDDDGIFRKSKAINNYKKSRQKD